MKKYKRKVLIIVSLMIVLVSIAGASYAWLQSSLAGDTKAGGNAGRISLNEACMPFYRHIAAFEMLPGEEVALKNKNNISVLYNGTRHGLIRVGIGDVKSELFIEEYFDGDVAAYDSWKTEYVGDDKSYTYLGKDTSADNRGDIYQFTDKRLREVLDISIDADKAGTVWFYGEKTGFWYRWVEISPERGGYPVEFDPANPDPSLLNLVWPVNIKFKGELGGFHIHKDNSGNSTSWLSKSQGITYNPGERTSSRQWEQRTEFNTEWVHTGPGMLDGYYEGGISLLLEAIQVTEEAVLDVWGQDALDDLKGMPIYNDFSVVEEWIYKGK